jgi:hypothetical protein
MNVPKHDSHSHVKALFGRSRRLQLGPWIAAFCIVSSSLFSVTGVQAEGSRGKTSSRSEARAHKKRAAAEPEGPPTAVLLATSGANGSALDSIIQAELEEMHVVNVTARPGMDLSAVLLALDCVSETAQCLRAVTAQNGSDVLISPSIAQTAGETVLSILRFDNADGQMKRVLRRQQGVALNSATLDAVPNMLRELFDLPPKEPPVEQPVAAAPTEYADPIASTDPALDYEPVKARSTPFPIGPVLLGAGGVVLLGTATAFGISTNSLQSDYNAAHKNPTMESLQHADSLSSTGKTNAAVATVLFSVGGAAIGGAAIWLAVELMNKPDREEQKPGGSDMSSSTFSLLPLLGPDQAGVLLTKRGVGL